MWIHNVNPWQEVADLARLADAGTWDTIYYADHYMPNTGTAEVADGDTYEAWSILPAIAAITERVRLGPLVAPTTVHHPALLANRAATIDRISNGRFVLGLGAGWQINEHHAYGIDLLEAKDRVDRFEEAIQITRSLLDNGRTTFDGSHFSIRDAPCEPHPVQDRLPILVGTGGNRMMGITARFADEWNTWGAPAPAAKTRQRFVAACENAGVDPASKHTSVQALVFLTDNSAAADKLRSKVDADRSIVGTSAELVEELGAYAEAGFDEFIVLGLTLGKDAAQRRDGYERFEADVAAQL